jgi:hypothetical protein
MLGKVRRFLARYQDGKRWKKRDVRHLAADAMAVMGRPCRYCDQTVKSLSFDHSTPISRGGETVPSNIVPLHSLCNRAKGAMSTDEWESFLLMLTGWKTRAFRLYIIRRLASGWRAGHVDFLGEQGHG